MRRNQEKEKAELQEKRILLVRAAIKENNTTKKAICKVCGIEMFVLNQLFSADKDLHAEYVIRRKTLVDVAADNLSDILNDPTHPQHFQATKYVLQNFKSDLDTSLEPKEQEEVQIEVPIAIPGGEGDGEQKPITIRFSKRV